MATQQTLATITAKVRQRADQIGSTTFDDVTELQPWIAASLRQLYTIFAQQDDDWFTTSFPLSLTAGVEAYTVPQSLLRISSVYCLYNFGANRIKLRQFRNEEFGALNYPAPACVPMAYRLIRNLLYIQPVPTLDAFNALEVSYVPEHRTSMLAYTAIDDQMPEGADEWLVLDVLQKMSVKTRLQNMDDITKSKADIEQRLKSAIRVRSDVAPRMRDGARPVMLPPLAYGTPCGPLYWATA